jgi:hypothetical protein
MQKKGAKLGFALPDAALQWAITKSRLYTVRQSCVV